MSEVALPLQPGRPVPDGPVELWFAVFDAAGTLLGAAPATAPLAWYWRDGRLNLAYGTVGVVLSRPGTYDYAMICAVSAMPQGSPFAPVWRISLSPKHELRAGDNIWITDGLIAIVPDAPLTG